MFRLLFTILGLVAASPLFAQCTDGVCFAPPHGSAVASGWQSRLVPVADAAVARRVAASTVRIVNREGAACSIGSGAIVEKDDRVALVLTCGHLFREGVGEVIVITSENTRHAARVLGVDSSWDIAALLIAAPNAPTLLLGSSPPAPGEPLTFCGYGPHGALASGGGNLLGFVRMQGTPSADTLQLAGAARQGDSGGPIVNARGEVVGLVVGTDGRIVIGPSCRPIARFLARFRSLLSIRGAPSFNRDADGERASPDAPNAAGERAAQPSPSPTPNNRPATDRQPGDEQPTNDVAQSQSEIRNLKSEILRLLVPIALAALGISVPPTAVLVALRVLRCWRRSQHRKVRRKRLQLRRSRSIQQEGKCQPANPKTRHVALHRNLNDDYAGQLASVFAYSGQSPLQDATLGREFSREIDRAAASSDAKLAEWATDLRDRVMRRFHRIHGWTPSPAEPAE